jgi:hypothetical protein
MAKTIKPRKTPQQALSRQTFRWCSCSKHRDPVQVFEGSPRRDQKKSALVDDLVEALMTIHRENA